VADERAIGRPSLDSRQLRDGDVFLACQGGNGHGSDYLNSAIRAGASAVLWEPAEGIDGRWLEACCARAGVAAVAVDDLAAKAGELAARYYGEPACSLTLIGVTGTDGKTSVSQFIARALDGAVIGTLGWGWPDELAPGELTTPDAVTLQAWLAELRDRGAEVVAMEVSSHALAQSRVAALSFDVAVLTNLGHDHLDYHGSLEAYRAAKRRLFELGAPVPVLNLDDEWGAVLASELAARAPVGYAMTARAARVRCLEFRPEADTMRLEAAVDGRTVTLSLPLVGRFNGANVLATAAALTALGVPGDALADRLHRIRPVPGRMEPVTRGEGPAVIVDYAHTPGALACALAAAREHCGGELWVVFGCGGNRDPAKRALMGSIAEREADRVVLTNDNPRYEDPRQIIDDIRTGMNGDCVVVTDRKAAICHAIGSAKATDCVLIAGKGHESWQDHGGHRNHFSDREEASAALEEVV
jgi:UDP-N-acetylmuramoyl-L-alanyl-D-glutamate--2,6-diaminopimelate ligase